MQTQGKQFLVMGMGLSGQSAAQFLLKRGAWVVGVDANRDLLQGDAIAGLCKQGLQVFHDSSELAIQDFDCVVVSPGIPQTHPIYGLARELEIIGETELALRFLKQKCLGITGTNGKTTVTSLVTHVLNFAGIKAKALGNIGTPLTSCVDEFQDDVAVLELSSFQLETMLAKSLDAAVLVNITPDHLDRYATMEDYARAKTRIVNCLKPHGKFFVEGTCWRNFKGCFPCQTVSSYGMDPHDTVRTDLINVYVGKKQHFALPDAYRARASHDLENLLAAYALCHEMEVSSASFLQALPSFQKPPHRIEFVCISNGVTYYDDSKGTNLDAVIRAVQVVEGEVILIAGGVHKGASYTPWIPHFKGKVKQVCALGQAAEMIKADIGGDIPVHLFATMEDSVRFASSCARKGDAVLLSPGCSSYDMFRDYAHRGNEFQRIVKTQVACKE